MNIFKKILEASFIRSPGKSPYDEKYFKKNFNDIRLVKCIDQFFYSDSEKWADYPGDVVHLLMEATYFKEKEDNPDHHIPADLVDFAFRFDKLMSFKYFSNLSKRIKVETITVIKTTNILDEVDRKFFKKDKMEGESFEISYLNIKNFHYETPDGTNKNFPNEHFLVIDLIGVLGGKAFGLTFRKLKNKPSNDHLEKIKNISFPEREVGTKKNRKEIKEHIDEIFK